MLMCVIEFKAPSITADGASVVDKCYAINGWPTFVEHLEYRGRSFILFINQMKNE